ncbi:hypothetical protein DVH24_013472 [Malus domestica]|uniref:RRM domain-containing protein n=1 Tax=Malus domestica TaxID=3750 RepID=A0A498HGX5_MALDO|nr:hypothetical protein DVH24_013472 [Malus domestica]
MVKGDFYTTPAEEFPDENTSLSSEPVLKTWGFSESNFEVFSFSFDEGCSKKKMGFEFLLLLRLTELRFAESNYAICKLVIFKDFDALCYMRTSKFEYAAFEEKVKRTVYLDNISPQVTESIVKTALSQFGTVKSVQFIPNYLNVLHCALVEMENPKEASVIGKEITEFRFMILGIPRLVRALSAAANVFDERPTMPRRQISRNSWRKKRSLQSEAFKANYKKYERLDSMMSDGTARCLSHLYKIRGADD